MKNYEQIAAILKALADPKRLKIVDLLSTADSLCACDLLEHFDFTQPTLSHHMKILEQAGIISVTKKSQWSHYTLQEEFVGEFLSALKEFLLKETAIR
jgi:ArsR family transcriptional regulator